MGRSPPRLTSAFAINPQMLAGANERLADMIVEGIKSQPDADAYIT